MESGGGSNRGEALRWLTIAEKLLARRDVHGARTFAIRARESDPGLQAPNQILAVADTLIAGETRIVTTNGNQHQDWYSILQVSQFAQNMDIISTQYRKLALLLRPQDVNRLPLSDEAFKLLSDAWSVLSNPTRKIMYDNQLQLSQLGDRPKQPQISTPTPPMQRTQSQMSTPPMKQTQPQMSTPPVRRSPRKNKDGDNNVSGEEGRSNSKTPPTPVTESTPTQARPIQTESTPPHARPVQTQSTPPHTRPAQTQSTPPHTPSVQTQPTAPQTRQSRAQQTRTQSDTQSFWTACPYCFYLYEYPQVYEDYTLKCQNCERAFHAVKIAPPPVTSTEDTYFCSWGFFPLGFSGNENDLRANHSNWTPVSTLFACPKPGGGGGGGTNKPRAAKSNTSKKGQFSYDAVSLSDSDSDDPVDESEDEWEDDSRKKKPKNVKAKASAAAKKAVVKRTPIERVKKVNQNHNQNQNQEQNVSENMQGVAETSGGRMLRSSGRKGNRLDLNVEFSNELEEQAHPGMRPQHREEDNIDGVGFFEGLDEFLSSLPILNVVNKSA